jgi:hypothetical protein
MNPRMGRGKTGVPIRFTQDGIFCSVKFELGQYTVIADNMLAKNSVILSAIMYLDEIIIDFPCDKALWKDILRYLSDHGVRRSVQFTGAQEHTQRRKEHALFFSGGLDSQYARVLLPDHVLFQSADARKLCPVRGAQVFRTNIMDFSYWRNYEVSGPLSSIEFLYPLISPFARNAFGIEKEVWDGVCFKFSFAEYARLLSKHGITLSSPLKHMQSWEYADKVASFVRCSSDGRNFCYDEDCSKCQRAFLFDFSGFDVQKYPLAMPKAKYIRTQVHKDYQREKREMVRAFQRSRA